MNDDNLNIDKKLSELRQKIEAIHDKIDALELPSKIEFGRLFRLADSCIELLAASDTEIADVRNELTQKNSAYRQSLLAACGGAIVYALANYFFSPWSVAFSIPYWIVLFAMPTAAAFQVWDWERKINHIRENKRHYRFVFYSAGFKPSVLYEISEIQKKERIERSYEASLVCDLEIELALKTSSFKLCRGNI